MASPLADLDELVLNCRNQKVKSYIKESVDCYKSGAFRSAIVSTWVAISFDIIEKLRELALTGDKEADLQIQILDKARKNNDIASFLKFEREILKIICEKLELISHIELIDLERLQEDRNRCAHPSMTLEGEIFNPPAELARVHIFNAVNHLLKHQPSQGKSALKYLWNEVTSNYFPDDLNKAISAFKHGPLVNARISLVNNFIIMLLKELLTKNLEHKKIISFTTALNAINKLHPKDYNQVFEKKISQIIRNLDDNYLKNIIFFLQRINSAWEYLDSDVQNKINEFVKDFNSLELVDLEFLISHKGLKDAIEYRFKIATKSEFTNNNFFAAYGIIGDRIIDLYSKSNTFSSADQFASTVSAYAMDYSKTQVETLIISATKNRQIYSGYKVSNVIEAIREKNRSITKDEINKLLEDTKLTELINN